MRKPGENKFGMVANSMRWPFKKLNFWLILSLLVALATSGTTAIAMIPGDNAGTWKGFMYLLSPLLGALWLIIVIAGRAAVGPRGLWLLVGAPLALTSVADLISIVCAAGA